MKRLTEKQQEILDFLEAFIRREGMAPTVYETADYFGITSPTVFTHFRALQRKGYINRTGKARSLKLSENTPPSHTSLTLSIPMLGRISAGTPLLAEENLEGAIQFDPAFLPRGADGHRLFCLKISGDSMRDLGILSGDIAIAKQTGTASTGDLVVVLDGVEIAVKALYIHDRQVELRPANPDYVSRFYKPDQVRVQGVILAVQRIC